MSAVNHARLAVMGGVAVIAGFSFIDRSVNYVPVNARVVAAKVDCYVEGESKVVRKGTQDLAYMDCALALAAATKFGYDEKHVHKRAVVKFSYTSPADGAQHYGEHIDRNAAGDYASGKTVEIFAHTTEAKTYRWN